MKEGEMFENGGRLNSRMIKNGVYVCIFVLCKEIRKILKERMMEFG